MKPTPFRHLMQRAVRGRYVMPSDGRKIWVDDTQAREVVRRVLLTFPEIDAEIERLRDEIEWIERNIIDLEARGFMPKLSETLLLVRIRKVCRDALDVMAFEDE